MIRMSPLLLGMCGLSWPRYLLWDLIAVSIWGLVLAVIKWLKLAVSDLASKPLVKSEKLN